MKILVTGASGNAGQVVCRELVNQGFDVRRCDVAPPLSDGLPEVEFVRCDTRTDADVRKAVEGCDAIVHLAAWHCAHNPPVSDATIFAVNVDGTFNVFEAARANGIQSLVFASSMAFGWGGVYGVTKVIGEDLCRMVHESTGASVAMLRYHDFVPKPYLAFGAKLLQNGVDRRDVATSTVASLRAAINRKIGLFGTIVHTNHGMPAEVISQFRTLGPDWCETQVPGAKALMAKYGIEGPTSVEQHDLSEAKRLLGWEPKFGFVEFLQDLKAREEQQEDVRALWAPGQTPD